MLPVSMNDVMHSDVRAMNSAFREWQDITDRYALALRALAQGDPEARDLARACALALSRPTGTGYLAHASTWNAESRA